MSSAMSKAPADKSALERARSLEAGGMGEAALAEYLALDALYDAARVAWQLGRARESADLLAKSGHHFEAARCFEEMGEPDRALHQLLRVEHRDLRYREACVRAIAIASHSGGLDLRLATFLAPFAVDAPRDAAEAIALEELAATYARFGLDEIAQGVRARLARVPGQEGAAPVARAPAPPSMIADADAEARALEEERAFRSRKKRRAVPIAEQRAMAPGRAQLDDALDEGSVINGRYALVRRLGRGGMATVFEARDLDLGGSVALKLFHEVLRDEQSESRFRREVQVSRLLNHANIVRVHDIGRCRGHKFITMELLVGRDLRSLLDEQRTLQPRTGIDILLAACAALGHAHSLEIVHRDVTPANLFMTSTGALKITDFGIARHLRSDKVTITGVILGTPEYMAPELVTDHFALSPSIDIYSLGVVAYRMFAGQAPFAGPVLEVLMRHVNEAPLPPRVLSPDLPEALEAVVLRMLAKLPRDRFPSCQAVGEELARVRAALG